MPFARALGNKKRPSNSNHANGPSKRIKMEEEKSRDKSHDMNNTMQDGEQEKDNKPNLTHTSYGSC